jgi:hypothetical protein
MPTSASPLVLPSSVQATFCQEDIDYYTVVLCPNAAVQAYLTFEHDDADLELDIELNGVIRGRSASTGDFEVITVTNSNNQRLKVEFVVWSSSGYDVPYTLNVTQTSGVDCLAATATAASTTTRP